MRYSVVVFGVKSVTRYFVEWLNENVCPVDLVVTVDESIPAAGTLSDWAPMDALTARWSTQLYKTKAYDLRDAQTAAFFAENEFGVGISMNWSRLIPAEILDRFEKGVFGLHGSCGYLPFGRGRATLNWAILEERRRILMHLFRMDAGADAPNIYARRAFEVTPFDDIRTLQYKDLLVSEQLAGGLLREYLAGGPLTTRLQESDPPMTYPGRRPEDGRIDLKASTESICRLVRAVTRPFPGALVYVQETPMLIWKAQPFDGVLDFSDYPLGVVIAVPDGNPIVRTTDGSLLITDYEAPQPLQPGDLLE